MAEFETLANIIEENSNELKRQLLGKKVPQDSECIQQLCIDYVGKLTGKDSVYMQQLSLLEQDLLTPVLKVMNALYASDIELSKKVRLTMMQHLNNAPTHQHIEVGRNQNVHFGKHLTKEYTPALAGAASGSLVGSLCKPGSWGVILLGSVISAIVGKVLYDLYIDNRNGKIVAEVGKPKSIIPKYILESSDVENIIRSLVSVGESVDKVLLVYRSHIEILQDKHSREKESYSLDKKFVEVLECQQTVLGNLLVTEDDPITKDSIKQIVNTLANQGFSVVHYCEENKAFFDTNYGNCESIEEFKPAIIRSTGNNGKAILRGEVLIPNSTQQ